MSSPVLTIAKREVVTRGRSKPFLIFTGILIALVLAVAVVIRVFGGDGDTQRVVWIGLTSEAQSYEDALIANSVDLEVVSVPVSGDGQRELADEEVDVVFDGETLYWNGQPDLELDLYIRSTGQQQKLTERAEALQLGPEDLESLFASQEFGEERLDGGDDEQGIRTAAALVSAIGIFMLLQIWGSFLMMGVIEEKSSKVVEILLSQVKPGSLLAGKILGLGVLALTQMAVIAIGLLVALSLIRDIEVPDGVWATVPLLAATFLLGFAFYATVFAAVGATVSRQEDATTAQLPAILPLLVGYFLAFTGISAPNSLPLAIGSFVPFTSPIVLPVRYALGTMPTWQAMVSLAILAVSAVIMIKIAGEVYRYSLLRTGTRIALLDAWKNRSDSDL